MQQSAHLISAVKERMCQQEILYMQILYSIDPENVNTEGASYSTRCRTLSHGISPDDVYKDLISTAS